MAKLISDPWFAKTIDRIEKLLELKLPIELYFFPSCGLNKAINLAVEHFKSKRINLEFIDGELNPFPTKSTIDEFIRNAKEKSEQNIKDNTHSVYWFRNIEEWDFTKNSNIFHLLNEIRRNSFDHFNFVVATTIPIERNILPRETYTYFYNYFIDPELNISFDKFLSDIEFKGREADVRNIKTLSGYMPSLAKSIVRDSRLQNNDQIPNEFSFEIGFEQKFPLLSRRLNRIFNSLSQTDISVLTKIAKRISLNNDENEIALRFQKIGFLDENFLIRSSLLENYLNKREIRSIPTKLISQEVVLISPGISLNKLSQEVVRPDGSCICSLSENEFSILNLLLEKKDTIVPRIEIAKLLWKDNYLIQYSDWAIDKAISTLRKKLGDKDLIKTVRSRGFILR